MSLFIINSLFLVTWHNITQYPPKKVLITNQSPFTDFFTFIYLFFQYCLKILTFVNL